MNECLTTQFALSEVSGCLVENPQCDYAHRFGFSFVCRHPDHASFRSLASGAMTKGDADTLYDTLRRNRRDEFTAKLDEIGRKAFCTQKDFHGQPLINIDMK